MGWLHTLNDLGERFPRAVVVADTGCRAECINAYIFVNLLHAGSTWAARVRNEANFDYDHPDPLVGLDRYVLDFILVDHLCELTIEILIIDSVFNSSTSTL